MLRPSEAEHPSADGNAKSLAFAKALHATARMIRDAGAQPMQQEAVRASVRGLCVFARDERMPPERFVVELKEMITGSDVLDYIPRDKHESVRRDVVAFAINAYYDDGTSR